MIIDYILTIMKKFTIETNRSHPSFFPLVQ